MYVKQYNDKGECTNPIIGFYANPAIGKPKLKKQRFFGNGKNTPLTVLSTGKYLRSRQRIECKDGTVKFIEHYILK